jgi:3-dehydroquinate synthase
MAMKTFEAKSRDFSYPVVVGEGAWRALRRMGIRRYTSTFVITEQAIWRRWGRSFLEEAGLGPLPVLFVPSGEASKSLHMLERLVSRLLRRRADRRSCLILFGGGVVGDLGGFVASVYMRGIDCIHVPTTILSQVDSAIGGKTAVNLGAMKNLVGTFHPGRAVLSEPRVLSTLRPRDFRSGLYEVVKHAILDGPELFGDLEANVRALHPGNIQVLARILTPAIKVKIDVVNRDEREAGERMALNLGHTFGHALEEATAYRRFLHGEAVAWGLLAVTRLSQRLGMLAQPEAGRITALVRQLGPLPPVRDLSPARILSLLPMDKKAVGGEIRWVLPEKIGRVRVMTDVPRRMAAAAFQDIAEMD